MKEPMNEEQFEALLEAEAARLPKSIEPERDLWAGVAVRIGVEDPDTATDRARYAWFGAAAAAVVLAIGVVVVQRAPVEQIPPTQTVAEETVLAEDLPPWQPPITRVRNQLSPDYESALARLSPNTRALVEENMKQIHTSLAAIHQALAEDPGNLALHQMLANTYQSELDLISQIGSLSLSETEL